MRHIVIHHPPKNQIVKQEDKHISQQSVQYTCLQNHFIKSGVSYSHCPDNAIFPSSCKNGVIHAVHNMEQADNQQYNCNTAFGTSRITCSNWLFTLSASDLSAGDAFIKL